MGKITLLIILAYMFIALCAFIASKRDKKVKEIMNTGLCEFKCKKCPLSKKCKPIYKATKKSEIAKEYLELK
jgi:hypothetical protein